MAPSKIATGDDRAELRVRAAPVGDRLIDATFDMETRGGRPTWTPPAAIEGGIRLTMQSLVPLARRCLADEVTTNLPVRFTVSPTGRASDVRVESAYGPARRCLARAIRGAVFPLSGRGRSWRVLYVFRL